MNDDYREKDWSELMHAHGTAEDVPQLLADLNSPDPHTREEALTELFGNIWHQGTVYPATAKALPELLDLLKSPACLDKNAVAILVASIAGGDGYHHTHSGPPDIREFFKTTVSPSGFSLGDAFEREADFLRVIREMSLQELPLLLPFLDSSDWCLRETIARVLQRYSAQIPDAVARLENRLAIEIHEDVRFQLEQALAAIRISE